jgi:prepilin-type N-terminal cleavage/methylation domain-containing protein
MKAIVYLRHNAGLSLVELLVTIAILTIILLPIGSSLSAGLQIVQQQLDYSEARQDVRMILNILANKVRRVQKVEIIQNPGETGSYMLRLTELNGETETYFKYKQGTSIYVIYSNGNPDPIVDLQANDVFTFQFYKTDGSKYSPLSVRQLQPGEYVELTLSITSREGGKTFAASTIVSPRNE